MEFRKMVMITLYAKQKKRQNRLLDSVGEGDGGMFRENSMYIMYSETDQQPKLDAWDKCSGLVHWEDPEELGEEGGARGVGMGNSCDSMGDSCQCMTKPTAMLWSNWPPTNKNKWKKKNYKKNARKKWLTFFKGEILNKG